MEKDVDPVLLNNSWMCIFIVFGTCMFYVFSIIFVSFIKACFSRTPKAKYAQGGALF